MENEPTPEPEEIMEQVGVFEPAEARRWLPQLEAAGIEFEIEADHTALLEPGRTTALVLGMYPPGSKILVFVPQADVEKAQKILAEA